ncbi:hypothetical protein LJB81_00850 [Desulfovibrio sp. OttesenSCG-928-M14]|nr:hypothetical protein [Desulfovibrio sp. OttesenSCG-928-M14]
MDKLLLSATSKNTTFDKDTICTDAKCDASNDDFIFNEDEFDIPLSIRDKLSGELDSSDFIWKGRDGLRYRIHTEYPYRVPLSYTGSIAEDAYSVPEE